MAFQELVKTDRTGMGRAAHHHIVYLNHQTQTGFASQAVNHTHQITFMPPQPESMDEFGNVIPANPGGFLVGPSPADGHVHGLTKYVVTKKKAEEDEDEIVEQVLAQYKAAVELERESIKTATEAENFYIGEQWESSDKADLEAKQRAALTINRIQRKVDDLCGYQRQQRTDIHYMPTEDGDARVADILNVVSKHILSRCAFEQEESDVFEDTAITGRGLFNFTMNFDKDIRGDIRIERYPWKDARFGPHLKKDLSDLEYLCKSKMYSKSKIKQLWPDKADKIEAAFELEFLETSEPHRTWSEDQYAHSDNKKFALDEDTALVDLTKKEIRVVERWLKVYDKTGVAAYPQDNFYLNLTGWEEKDVDQIETIPGFSLVEHNTHHMRVTKIAGSVLLSDEAPADVPAQDFYVIPVYGKKRGDTFWGKVGPAVDAQKQKNKHASQAIDITNKMLAYGWFVDETTFPGPAEEKAFIKNSSSPGFVVKVNATEHPPVKVEGIKFPNELVNIMTLDDQTIDEMLATVPIPTGANESAAHFMELQRLKLLGSEWLFDNLSFAKKRIGELLIGLIQKYYSPDRITRIINNANAKNPVQLGGQPLESFAPDEIISLVETADLANYDVVVAETNWSPTVKTATFMMLSDMMKSGAPIPPNTLLGLMDAPDEVKKKMMQDIAAQQQAQAAEAQQTYQMEIDKTMIAKGFMPASLQQQGQQYVPIQAAMPQGSALGEPTGVAPAQPAAPATQGPDNETLAMVLQANQQQNQATLGAIQGLAQAVAMSKVPVTFNVDPNKKKKKVGRILRDGQGNSLVEIDEIPEPELPPQ